MLQRLVRIAGGAALLLASLAPAASGASYSFSVRPVDEVLDLHGNPQNAQLVVFMAGNQFMVAPALVAAFRKAHPQVRRIFYETLPPGILARQMVAKSIRIGNLVVAAPPDVLLSGRSRMHLLRAAREVGKPESYASNVLAIMVRKGDPKNIRSLRDLARANVRVAMPNVAWEGVAKQIDRAFKKAGGTALIRAITVTKVAEGTTTLTQIHHRQTPLLISAGKVDAGPVWISEALYQQRIGAPIGLVRIPASQNVTADYQAAVLRNAPHPAAGKEFLAFLRSSSARTIFASYGFGPPK